MQVEPCGPNRGLGPTEGVISFRGLRTNLSAIMRISPTSSEAGTKVRDRCFLNAVSPPAVTPAGPIRAKRCAVATGGEAAPIG